VYQLTQDFGENEDKNHADEQPGLLGRSSYTGITNNTDSKTRSHTSKTDRETGAQLDEVGEEGRVLFQVVRDQDGHDQAVDTNDTSHDNGNDVWTSCQQSIFVYEDASRSMWKARDKVSRNVLLTIRSGRRTPMAETPTPALAVP
jgi:hypothetical protein